MNFELLKYKKGDLKIMKKIKNILTAVFCLKNCNCRAADAKEIKPKILQCQKCNKIFDLKKYSN